MDLPYDNLQRVFVTLFEIIKMKRDTHQRKFQFKMGLPKIIQIPCHHVLANQNSLKLKKGAPLKQFFNINLGIGIIKKLFFLFVFSTYLPMYVIITLFWYFLFQGQQGISKVCRVGTRWMWNLIPHPTSSPNRNLSKKTGKYVKNTNKKQFFYDTYPQIYIKKLFKT